MVNACLSSLSFTSEPIKRSGDIWLLICPHTIGSDQSITIIILARVNIYFILPAMTALIDKEKGFMFSDSQLKFTKKLKDGLISEIGL